MRQPGCCAARPVVQVVPRAGPARNGRLVEILLCARHYYRSLAVILASRALIYDRDGARILGPLP